MIERRPFLDKSNPEVYKAMVKASNEAKKAAHDAGLGDDLLELVKTRASQINGCVTCLSIHVPDARKAGVSDLKLDILPAWRDSKEFTDQERVALMLTESLTSLDLAEDRNVTVAFAKKFFSIEQITALEWVIIIINAFNKISIASGHPAIKK